MALSNDLYPELINLPGDYFGKPCRTESHAPKEPGDIEYAIAGAGPRAAKLIAYLALEILANRDKIPKPFRLTIDVFEKQHYVKEIPRQPWMLEAGEHSLSKGGVGGAFQTDCDAALNNRVPGRITIPDHDALPEAFKSDAENISNAAVYICAYLMKYTDTYYSGVHKRNPSASTMLKQAIDEEGKPDMSFPCAIRRSVGVCEVEELNRFLEIIQNSVPEMVVRLFYDREVTDINLQTPTRPEVTIRDLTDLTTKKTETLPYDFVLIATVTVPAFSNTPNWDKIEQSLREQELFEKHDRDHIKPGSRILITGASFAAYDYAAILMSFTPMQPDVDREDPKSYQIKTERADNYENLFTFVSPSDGQAPPPWHVVSAKRLGSKAFLTTEEAHAMFLQKGFSWLPWVKPIITASIAYELNECPEKVKGEMTMNEIEPENGTNVITTKNRMINYHEQTCNYMNGNLTTLGLERAFYSALLRGNGTETEPELKLAKQELKSKAPLTRLGRSKWLHHRAAAFDLTRPEIARSQPTQNEEFFNHWKMLMFTVAPSPIPVQDAIAQLFKANVARHVKGSAKDITYDEARRKFELNGEQYDYVFDPKRQDRDSDVLLKAIQDKVDYFVPGAPRHAKGRILKRHDDSTPTHVINVGCGGQGNRVTSSNEKKIVIGMQWTELDTSDYESATTWAADTSKTMLLLGILKARGVANASQEFLDAYDKTLPTETEFNNETKQFDPAWNNLNRKRAFLQVCIDLIKDKALFHDYAGQCLDEEKRQAAISNMKNTYPKAEDKYNRLISEIPPFQPVGLHAFMERYVDPTRKEIGKVWDSLLKE